MGKNHKISFWTVVLATALAMFEKPIMKKVVNWSLIIFFVIGCYFVLRNDSNTYVSETKSAIYMMAKNGLSEEKILGHYSFREYPRSTIIHQLQESGEFQKLVQKGREK